CACGVDLPCALIQTWTESCPREQLPVRLEAAHVDTDLAQQRRHTDVAQPWNFPQSRHGLPKGFHRLVDIHVQRGQGVLRRFDLPQVHAEQASLLESQPALESLQQLCPRDSQPTVRQVGKAFSVCLSGNQRFQDGTAADAQDVTDDPCDLQACDVEGFLHAQRVTCYLSHKLLPRARELS